MMDILAKAAADLNCPFRNSQSVDLQSVDFKCLSLANLSRFFSNKTVLGIIAMAKSNSFLIRGPVFLTHQGHDVVNDIFARNRNFRSQS